MKAKAKRVGRPSKYSQVMCRRVYEAGCRGASVTQMAIALGVRRQTLENWAREHPEFLDAYACARVASQAWWEDLGQINVINPHFNARAYAAEMCRRFPRDYAFGSRRITPEAPSEGDRHEVKRVIVFPETDGSAEG